MPSKEQMPLCPSAIAVSKPRRDTWSEEELLDTLVPWDPDVRIEHSGFPGVLLVYSRLDPYLIGRVISSGYHAFVKRVIPSLRCLTNPRRQDLISEVKGIVEAYKPNRVRLLTSIRGSGKEIATSSTIEEIVRGLNVVVDKRSKTVLCVESINNTFILSLGEARLCGPDCIVILPYR